MVARRKIYRHRAAWARSRILLALAAPLGSGAPLAPALAGRLPANVVRVRLGLRLGLGGGSPSRSVLNHHLK